jgi:Mor family transcriptional regulator
MSNFLTELRNLEIPENIILQLTKHFGGMSVYIPKSDKKTQAVQAARNNEIYHRFTGHNAPKLARQYDLTVSTICRIIKKKRLEKQRDWTR